METITMIALSNPVAIVVCSLISLIAGAALVGTIYYIRSKTQIQTAHQKAKTIQHLTASPTAKSHGDDRNGSEMDFGERCGQLGIKGLQHCGAGVSG